MAYRRRWPRYVSVAEKREKAEKKLEKLRKKNPDINPVAIDGRDIAKTWWGKEWNKNLERYADYANRIERGRSYVRHGAVLDLAMEKGEIRSLVQGGPSKAYSVIIKIKGLPKKRWETIKAECKGKMDSLQTLLAGEFPKALAETFTKKGVGLFPAPDEINFSCSCPDWADMCKHVAATLYGAGARLDEKPGLFFTLRNIDMNDLISEALKDKTKELLKKSAEKTDRALEESDLSSLFGIDMEDGLDFHSPAPVTHPLKKPLKSPDQKKIAGRPRKKIKTPLPEAGKKTAAPQKNRPAIDIVFAAVEKSKKGIGMAELKKKTGFEETKIYNIIYRLKKQNKVRNLSRGVYAKIES